MVEIGTVIFALPLFDDLAPFSLLALAEFLGRTMSFAGGFGLATAVASAARTGAMAARGAGVF